MKYHEWFCTDDNSWKFRIKVISNHFRDTLCVCLLPARPHDMNSVMLGSRHSIIWSIHSEELSGETGRHSLTLLLTLYGPTTVRLTLTGKTMTWSGNVNTVRACWPVSPSRLNFRSVEPSLFRKLSFPRAKMSFMKHIRLYTHLIPAEE